MATKTTGLTLQAKQLAHYINDWINIYVPKMRCGSVHTEKSYRISLSLFVQYLEGEKNITPYTLSIDCFSADMLNGWVVWLLNTRKIKARSCNARMAAIKNLLKYVGGRDVAFAHLYLNAKEHVKKLRESNPKVNGMSHDAVKTIFAMPDTDTDKGLRDLVLMMMCYGFGGRIDEILSIKVRDVHTESKDPYVILHGKGSKIRSIYMQEGLLKWFEQYMSRFHGNTPNPDDYLFYSPCHGLRNKLTQPAISKRMKLYANMAREACGDVPTNMHAHLWRHTSACHWRDNGINIIEIKELMGHASLTSTMIYQDVTEEQKIEAVKTLDDDVTKSMTKKWKLPENRGLAELFGLDVK